MRATTPTFKQIMASGNSRDYVVKIDLTLADSNTTPTVLHLTEADIWNDTFSVETASSGSSSFDIGTAIIGQCKFSLNNFDERFNQYDFFNATAVVWVGLKGDTNNGTQVYYRLGFFTVDEPEFAGALIQLVCLDNMWKFDRPLKDVNLSFPISARNAVIAICSYCGVILNTQQFHGYNFTITEAPKDDMNCREFLQYVAMIGCNFCVIDSTGALCIKWYDTASIPSESDLDGGTFDTNTTPYSDGDSADGGNFTNYSSGDSIDGGNFSYNQSVAYFTRNFKANFGTDTITITGVKFVINETEHRIGTDGYVLELSNPLVTESNVNSVLNLIWDVLENFTLRTFNLTTTSDLSVEVGDCCAIKDYKGNYIYSWITVNTFKFSSHSVQCNAVAPTRTLVKRYSKAVQAAVEEARKSADKAISNYDLAVQMMNNLAVNAMGGYEEYEDLPTGGRVWYLSNMPITKNPTTGVCSFETGSTVYKKSGDGFFVSRDGGITWVNGYNMSTGELVVNVLDAIGINFDWARGGTLTLGGDNNTNGILSILDAQGRERVHGDNTGVKVGRLGSSELGSVIFLDTEGQMQYYYNRDYSGKMRMTGYNFGDEQHPDIRDSLTVQEFDNIVFLTDTEKVRAFIQNSGENKEYGNVYIYAESNADGSVQYQDSQGNEHDESCGIDIKSKFVSIGSYRSFNENSGWDELHPSTDNNRISRIELRADYIEVDGPTKFIEPIYIDDKIFVDTAEGYVQGDSHYLYVKTSKDSPGLRCKFANGLLLNDYTSFSSEPVFDFWHRINGSFDSAVQILLMAVGSTSVTWNNLEQPPSGLFEYAFEPFVRCAPGVKAPKIIDMSQNGSSLTVYYTEVTAEQGGEGGNLCQMQLRVIV